MECPWPWIFFDPSTERKKQPARQPAAVNAPKREERLFCRFCRHFITTQNQRITVNGGHEHSCTNPHGHSFHIGCFREAEGCRPIGPSTDDHSWFPGYRWRVTLCRGCEAHLGWTFQAADGDAFHGLILDRLSSRGDRPSA